MARILVKALVPDWQFDVLIRSLEGEAWVTACAGEVRTVEMHDDNESWVRGRLERSESQGWVELAG